MPAKENIFFYRKSSLSDKYYLSPLFASRAILRPPLTASLNFSKAYSARKGPFALIVFFFLTQMPGSFVDMIYFNDQPWSRGLWRLSCSHAGALIPNYFPHIFPSLSVSSSVSVMCCIVHVPFVKGFLPSPKQLCGIFVLSLRELHTF